MTYATTFSGIGGWELGLNACGWELLWQCECEPFCRALLAERFGVPIYSDIRTLADEQPPAVDCLVGSPPCQPFSVAGAQRGTRDERHLYPSFLRAVRVLKPRWVLMEQVPAILSLDGGRAFGQYIGGLAALGYDLVWHCLPACAVGAPHRRDRLWIIAHAHDFHVHDGRLLDGDVRRIRFSEAETSRNLFIDSDPNYHDRDGRAGDVQMGRKRRSKTSLSTVFERRGKWSSKPKMGRVAYGIPHRLEQLGGLGNAVVPQIPFILGQAINEVDGQ